MSSWVDSTSARASASVRIGTFYRLCIVGLPNTGPRLFLEVRAPEAAISWDSAYPGFNLEGSGTVSRDAGGRQFTAPMS